MPIDSRLLRGLARRIIPALPEDWLPQPVKDFRRDVMLGIVWVWRRLMFRTTFIAISGSVGKSTCEQAVGHVLASRFRVVRTDPTSNHYKGLLKTVLRVMPWHRFAVLEIGITEPGQMVRFARALRPDVAILTSVARTHTMNFRSLETTAHEKSRLIEGVRPGGLAILNDDNPWLAGYDPPPSVRVMRYGNTARSVMHVTDVRSSWPERLTFTAVPRDSEPVTISTRYVGKHWVGSLLPSLILASEAGMSMTDAAAALAMCEPMERRLSPAKTANGATILRDDLNGSVDTLTAALKVFEEASARRKMIVFTDVSDSTQKPRKRVADVGKTAARIADAAIFLGEHGQHGARAAVSAGMSPDQVWSFINIQEGASQLKQELREGDLVLLRGRRVDHLARVYLSLTQDVTCWRNLCPKPIQCEKCRLLDAKRPVA
jgi:UDP-N-acetylmuramoyl-tripeptide--D-alanyl-D-alanine ligase